MIWGPNSEFPLHAQQRHWIASVAAISHVILLFKYYINWKWCWASWLLFDWFHNVYHTCAPCSSVFSLKIHGAAPFAVLPCNTGLRPCQKLESVRQWSENYPLKMHQNLLNKKVLSYKVVLLHIWLRGTEATVLCHLDYKLQPDLFLPKEYGLCTYHVLACSLL